LFSYINIYRTHYSAAILVWKSAKSVLAATSAFNVVSVIVSACNALAANAPCADVAASVIP